MTDARATEAKGPAAGRERLLAALLAVALLLCHGALGASHQVSSETVERDTNGHHGPASWPSDATPHSEHHDASVARADCAALFVVLLGTALALCLGRFSTQSLAAAPRHLGRVLQPLFLRPPRGPTLPLLQVFRL